MESIDQPELDKFDKIADQWWDPCGDFRLLHAMNPLRLRYILDHLSAPDVELPMNQLSILDVGCGGGLLSIPLSAHGPQVFGIDPLASNIDAATRYIQKNGITGVAFSIETAESLSQSGKKFDAVIALEVIEHISDDNSTFLDSLVELLKPGGKLFVSTINRNLQSFMQAIVAAEYILHLVPPSTHSWKKFIKPSELEAKLRSRGMVIKDITGMKYNPLLQKWSLGPPSVNYISTFRKHLPSIPNARP